MLTILPAAALGFVVGLRHATEADHVAAVSAIVARERTVRGAALIGAAWGAGHTFTLCALGGAIVVFGLAVPRSVALSLELAVGAMLIGLGAWNVASRRHAHHHVARHDAAAIPAPAERAARLLLRRRQYARPRWIRGRRAARRRGRPQRGVGLAYLFVFGLGTTLGMTLITALLSLPLGGALRRFRNAVTCCASDPAVSCAIGALLVYQIAFHDGLFLADARTLTRRRSVSHARADLRARAILRVGRGCHEESFRRPRDGDLADDPRVVRSRR
ncbi:MAG: hypothetical protein U0270_46355 [Labilithrix sp.]